MRRKKTLEGFHHPLWAKYLLFVCLPKAVRENILGDLEEGFTRVASEFGLMRARAYYSFQVITTVGWFGLKRVERSKVLRAILLLFILLVSVKLRLVPIDTIVELATGFLR
jgi:hypothetical protein